MFNIESKIFDVFNNIEYPKGDNKRHKDYNFQVFEFWYESFVC